MSQIDEVKSRLDIVDVIGESVKLRRTGKNYSGLCPFHSEKTPSFIVSPDRQTWRCFGQCNEGGDVISFVMKKEGWDFGEALRSLAQRAGVQLEKFRAQKPEEKEEHERLRALLEEAALFFRHQLVNTEEGKPALAYLREKRKLSDATMETFGLGYAPRGWDNAIKHLTGRGFTDKELIDAGIVSVREENRDTGAQEHRRAFDRFRERIMIPIRDANGKMAGFGARILRPDDFPKFLNSPETPLFSKSRLLYGMDRARKAIRATDQAVIVEGYLDVIAVHQAGFENVVSPMGTALTEDQLRLIKRFTRNIVLALDPDAAGKMAVLHGLETARQSLGGKVPVFDEGGDRYADAPSLLRFADRLQADLKVVALPDGLDPDELVERNRDEWVELVKSAKPIVLHVMQTLIAQHGLDTPKEKAKIVDEMVPFISGISDPVERDDYRQKLARLLKVDERSLLVEMHASGARKTRPRPRVEAPAPAVEAPAKAAPVPGSASYRIEAHILGILLRRPDLLYRFDRLLQEASLSRLTPEDFGYTDHQVFFRLARQSLEQDAEDPDRYLVDHLPETLALPAGELMAKTAMLDPVDDRLLEDMLRGIIKMRKAILSENINQLRFLQEEAQQSGDLRAESYREMVQQLTRTLRTLDQAGRKSLARR